MKVVVIVFFLVLAGCSSTQPNLSQGNTSIFIPAHIYRCESGETITASYLTIDSANITYKGSVYNLKIAVSASGARYVGDSLEWWIKSSDGTLLQHNADGTSGERIELCTQA